MIKKLPKLSAIAFLFAFSSGSVLAHTTIKSEATLNDGVPDGVSTIHDFSIPHGCNGEPVRATTMLFPNSGDFVAEDQDGNPVDPSVVNAALEDKNNILMGPKPAQDANWKKQKVLTGPVRLYNSHGDKTTDVRAFVYAGGKLKNELLSLTRWRATSGKIKDDSCVKSIEVRVPIVNYCLKDPNSPARMDAWIGRPTALFNDNNGEVLSDGFWPRFVINNTGYDAAACNGVATVYKVSPTDEDIDTYLPLDDYDFHGNHDDDDDDHHRHHRG